MAILNRQKELADGDRTKASLGPLEAEPRP
jgi:hypothetical protein